MAIECLLALDLDADGAFVLRFFCLDARILRIAAFLDIRRRVQFQIRCCKSIHCFWCVRPRAPMLNADHLLKKNVECWSGNSKKFPRVQIQSTKKFLHKHKCRGSVSHLLRTRSWITISVPHIPYKTAEAVATYLFVHAVQGTTYYKT